MSWVQKSILILLVFCVFIFCLFNSINSLKPTQFHVSEDTFHVENCISSRCMQSLNSGLKYKGLIIKILGEKKIILDKHL